MIDPIIVRQRLGENLSWVMSERDTSLSDLADAISANPSTIHRLRHGENDPSFSLAARIADYFGVLTDDFLLPPREFQRVYRVRQQAREPIPA